MEVIDPAEAAALPRTFTVVELQRILRTGKRQTLDLIHTGRLRHVRIGEKSGRIRVSEEALREFMNSGQEPATEGQDLRHVNAHTA